MMSDGKSYFSYFEKVILVILGLRRVERKEEK